MVNRMIKTIIYCASGYAERVLFSLDETKYDVIALIDSNPETWGQTLYGLEVISPNEIVGLDYDLVIISLSEYAKEISDDLIKKYDVDKTKIITYLAQEHGICWQEERIIVLRKVISLLKERHIRGNMAEVGVYRGDFAKLFNRYFPDKKLYLFDTFSGFDEERDLVSENDKKNFKDTSIDIVMEKMKSHENCIIKKGYFPDTAQDVEDEFCLVSLDCDMYNPILAGLEYFYPRLVQGGWIFVHDFGSYHYKGVRKAVYEYCTKNNIPFFPMVDRGLSVVISK